MKEKTKTKSTAREQAFYTPHLSTLKPVFLESQTVLVRRLRPNAKFARSSSQESSDWCLRSKIQIRL